jgi:exonuclease III
MCKMPQEHHTRSVLMGDWNITQQDYEDWDITQQDDYEGYSATDYAEIRDHTSIASLLYSFVPALTIAEGSDNGAEGPMVDV